MLVGLVPYFEAADKVAPQNVYLNLVNICAFLNLFFFKRKNIFKELAPTIQNISFVLLLLFFIWSSFSLIFTINLSESLATLGEIFTLLVTFNFLLYFISKIKDLKSFFFYVIITLTTIDIISIIVPYILEINATGVRGQRSSLYRSYSGNINIMAYLLLIKYPFLLYFQIFKIGNKYINTLYSILIVFIISALFATRSAILSIVLISIILLMIFSLLKIFKDKVEKINLYRIYKLVLTPLLVGFLLNNIESKILNTTNVQSRISTVNLTEDQSIGERLRYYKAAINSFLEKPIFGKGIGSWEIESIKYEKAGMENYVVPYHAHNDFLEILAETGIVGMLLYFGIIFYVFFELIKSIFFRNHNDKYFLIFLLTSLLVYLIDSSFNFPFARIVQQVNLLFLLAFSVIFLKLNNLKLNIIKPLFISIIFLTPISLYSASRLFISSKHQAVFLRQFNAGDYSYPSIEEIKNYELKYKNLTATTLPMNTILGLYMVNNNRLEESVPYFKKGIKHNPYLYISESFLGYVYQKLDKPDSALYYTKVAYENMPRNTLHFAHYINSLVYNKDSIGIKSVYSSIPQELKKNEKYFDEIYLLAMSVVLNQDDESTKFALDDFDFNIQTGNDRLKKGFYLLKVGEEKMFDADRFYQTGVYYFENENFQLAHENFIKADSLNPFELAYKENAANSLLKIGEDLKALAILNDLIENYNSSSPKAFYLRGLILYERGNKANACKDLSIANDSGLFAGSNLFELLCN